MEKLPPEIVLNIANMIPRHEEFYNLARTCRGLWHVLRLVLIRRDIEKTCLHAPTAKLGDELSVSVGHTPALHHAIAHGQTENVDVPDNDDECCHDECCHDECCHDQGRHPKWKVSPPQLMAAYQYHNQDINSIIIDALLACQNHAGCRETLRMAMFESNVGLVELLLDKGVALRIRPDHNHDTAMHIALKRVSPSCKDRRVDILKLLLGIVDGGESSKTATTSNSSISQLQHRQQQKPWVQEARDILIQHDKYSLFDDAVIGLASAEVVALLLEASEFFDRKAPVNGTKYIPNPTDTTFENPHFSLLIKSFGHCEPEVITLLMRHGADITCTARYYPDFPTDATTCLDRLLAKCWVRRYELRVLQNRRDYKEPSIAVYFDAALEFRGTLDQAYIDLWGGAVSRFIKREYSYPSRRCSLFSCTSRCHEQPGDSKVLLKRIIGDIRDLARRRKGMSGLLDPEALLVFVEALQFHALSFWSNYKHNVYPRA